MSMLLKQVSLRKSPNEKFKANLTFHNFCIELHRCQGAIDIDDSNDFTRVMSFVRIIKLLNSHSTLIPN